jgi:filamentous hemagglutinin family protein
MGSGQHLLRTFPNINLNISIFQLVFTCLMHGVWTESVTAQIIPDESLQGEQSRLIQNRPNRIDIDGGAKRGANLFHSFREFSLDQEDIVYFRNPAGVDNIFSRVTGRNPSNILGGLGVRGNANLFLINPNGILLGEQAIVNVSGSFVATTATAIQFGSESFDTANPNVPSPLLNINPSAFLFNQQGVQAATIEQRGQLIVDTNRSIVLLSGANLLVSGGQLGAPSGGIELGAVQSLGTVNLRTQENQFRLEFPSTTERGDVEIENSTTLAVSGRGAGNIAVRANNLTINDSLLTVASDPTRNSTAQPIGNIRLDATGHMILSNSGVTNLVPLGQSGRGGRIDIVTNSLLANQGTRLETTNLGTGQAGNISIQAEGRVIFGGEQTRVRATNNQGLLAEAGSIQINAQSLAVTEGARLTTSTFGQGNAGDITIAALQRVLLEGTGANRLGGGLYSTVERNAVGNGGDITIRAGNLTVLNGAGINSRSLSQGNSGNISVIATGDVRFSGTSSDPAPVPSGIFSAVEAPAVGDGGTIRIDAQSLQIENGAQLQANLLGNGTSGDILIRVDGDVVLDGANRNGARSGIFTSVGSPDAVGTGGNIRIFANSLLLTNGTQLISSTQGQGDAGNVRLGIQDRILLERGGSIFTNVLPTAIGAGGDINLNTNSLSITGGSQLATSTAGTGNAGNISLTARDTVLLRGTPENQVATGLLSDVLLGGVGEGGNIDIQTRHLELNNRAQISARSQGAGNAGKINISIDDQLNATDSDVNTAARNASGGAINITGRNIRLRGDADIETSVASGRGEGGNITVDADTLVAFDDSDIIASAEDGRGGDIDFVDTIAFFQNYSPEAANAEPRTLELNNRADANATGAEPGTISISDTSFIQNSLSDLPDSAIDTEALLANSCIAQTDEGGTFLITGTGGLPSNRPGTAPLSPYPTDRVRSTPDEQTWQPGDPIIEPQGVYRLPNGDLVMMHECS